MVNIQNKTRCSGCEACYNICPKNAIKMKPDSEGFLYPLINKEKCINCGLCDKVCPYKNRWEPKFDLKKLYIGFNTNSNERQRSSSGGIFVLLAKEVLKQGGVVYGAAYDDQFMTYHTKVEELEQLQILMGSKYVQSRIGDVFLEVKEYLNQNRKVMFVGTACQIAGLKGFLKKEYNSLLTVDFICLGIPSPKIWREYLDAFFEGEKVEDVNFKNKLKGWHKFSLYIKTNKRVFISAGKKNIFFSGYFKGLYSRPSCSSCEFKNKRNRISDITLSDSWGCEKFAQELDDDKGLSNIIIHSPAGMEFFEHITENISYKEMSFDKVIVENKNYYSSNPLGEKRKKFWEEYDTLKRKKIVFYKYCFNFYGIKSWLRSIKKIIKKYIG